MGTPESSASLSLSFSMSDQWAGRQLSVRVVESCRCHLLLQGHLPRPGRCFRGLSGMAAFQTWHLPSELLVCILGPLPSIFFALGCCSSHHLS